MNKDGNSLAPGVGYWHKTSSSGAWKPSPRQNLCEPPPRKSRNKGTPGDARVGIVLRPPARLCWRHPNPSCVPGTCGSTTSGMGKRGEPGSTASAGRPPVPPEGHSQLHRPRGHGKTQYNFSRHFKSLRQMPPYKALSGTEGITERLETGWETENQE